MLITLRAALGCPHLCIVVLPWAILTHSLCIWHPIWWLSPTPWQLVNCPALSILWLCEPVFLIGISKSCQLLCFLFFESWFLLIRKSEPGPYLYPSSLRICLPRESVIAVHPAESCCCGVWNRGAWGCCCLESWLVSGILRVPVVICCPGFPLG